MSKQGWTVFDSPIGAVGLAWSDSRISGVQLPEFTPDRTREKMTARFPDYTQTDPRGAVRRARDDIQHLLNGRARDFASVELDLDRVTPFRRAVYQAAREIGPGQTMSYGELAGRVGNPKGARAIGQAMGANPLPILVPCHRVLASGARTGGFTAAGGAATKAFMLRTEGVDGVHVAGFDYDPFEAYHHLRGADPRLAAVMDAVGPPKIELRHTSSIFVALARAIVYQQLSGKAAGTIFGRVCDVLGGGEKALTAANITAASAVDLRGAGLSNNKMLALQDLSARSLAGEIPGLAALRKLDDEAIIERLTAVRGIGRWTVEMMLMFRLGRGDVMAIDDLGLRQGHAVIMRRKGETERKKLMRYAERWRPYRSVASWYLWRAVELKRGY